MAARLSRRKWSLCTDPRPMLACLRTKAIRATVSNRKLRLFGVACCRRIWELLPNEYCLHAVEVAERLADGQASERERGIVCGLVAGTIQTLSRDAVQVRAAAHSAWCVAHASEWVAVDAGTKAHEAVSPAIAEEKSIQADLLRCIFGNSLLPVTLNSAWLTPDVVGLARTAYEERAFDQLPILGDALEDAGCEEADVLTHCRSQLPHTRGCWVVDGVLGLK